MSEWKAKRFWKDVSIEEVTGGFSIALDIRPVKTPAKRPLLLPSKEFAEAVAQEWRAQSEKIDPLSMPFTRSANAAIDKVAIQHAEVADLLADYADSDLLCYRAEHPKGLVARQCEQWDPILDWAADALSARLEARAGVIHVPQQADVLAVLRDRVHRMSHFQLAGFHDLVSLSGSLILAFAATENLHEPEAIWDISRLDEIWQAEEWGRDEEAEQAAAIKKQAFVHAKQVFDHSTL